MCILISQCFCDKKYLIFLSNLYLIPFKKDWGLIANVFMLDLLTKKKNKTLSLSLFATEIIFFVLFYVSSKKKFYENEKNQSSLKISPRSSSSSMIALRFGFFCELYSSTWVAYGFYSMFSS